MKDLLFDLGVDTTASLHLRDKELAERLSSTVRGKLDEAGISQEVISDLVSVRYCLDDFHADAQLVSDTVDACGRAGGTILALKTLENRDVAIGRALYLDFRTNLINMIGEAVENMVTLNNIRYFVHGAKGYGGLLCSTLVKYVKGSDLPIVSMVDTGDYIDLSSRCSPEMERKGINLASAMNFATVLCSGEGGGHTNAAGGRIKPEYVDQFLKNMDWAVGMQIHE